MHKAMDNQNLAAECFREALRLDVFSYEAFSSLIGHHLLTAQQGTCSYIYKNANRVYIHKARPRACTLQHCI